MQQVNISTTKSLQDYFLGELKTSTSQHHVDAGDDTLWYLSNLLYNYRRSEQFFDYRPEGGTLTPLAEYYRQASEANSDYERRLFLQRLGDVSLFVASLFRGALKRKPVNVSYYVSMGEGAYATLAEAPVKNSRDSALHSIFEQLSDQFEEFVIAISELSNKKGRQQTLIEQVHEWEKTADPVLGQELRNKGIMLPESPKKSH